jgi:hypothetical protein
MHTKTGVQNLRELLKHFTYKPGWSFRINTFMGNMLMIEVKAIDADNPSHTIGVCHSFKIPDNANEKQLMKLLREEIIHLETHEVDEFFQVNGIKVFDPHRIKLIDDFDQYSFKKNYLKFDKY